MQNTKIILYCFLSVLLITGCNQGKRIKIGDDKQNTETRLIVTNSDALEMLIGLGAAENIVGVNDVAMRRSFFDKNQKWSSIGNWQNPNIEAITNLEPDVVVAYTKWPDPAGFDDKLKPFNIPVERINCSYMSEYHSDIARLASFVGKESRADTMIHDFDRIIELIKNTVASIEIKKTVYLEFGDFTAIGVETGNSEMLELANTINIASKLGIQFPKVSTEWLLEENPDIIIKIVTTSIVEDMYESLITRAGWSKLDAVKNKQVFLLSTELCSGPRAMIGSLYIAKWCYPEKFASIDPDSVHIDWLNKYYQIPHEEFTYTY